MERTRLVNRPNINQNIITELEKILLNGSPTLQNWLNPRIEEGKIFFDEIEGLILAQKPS